MANIVAMLALLLVPYWALLPMHISDPVRGQIGVTLVFLFTGLGHFIKTEAMAQMLPPRVPLRIPLIYVTGVLELLGGVAVLWPPTSRWAGIMLCIFLVSVLPSNVYAAIHRVDFGGHGMGPKYLLVRVPLQLFLIGWIYWFVVGR